MAETISTTFRSDPSPAGPSKSRLNSGRATINDKPSAPSTFSIYVGKSTLAPTTFAGLSISALCTDGTDADSLGYQNVPAGWNVQCSFSAVDLSAFTVGDQLWLCLFEVAATPSGGQAVSASVNLGLLIA
jgi:hypothetical protein